VQERIALARIRQHGERRMWTCPECNRIMGELTETRLVVIIRKYQRISFRIVDGMEMTCPHCHVVSVYTVERKGAA